MLHETLIDSSISIPDHVLFQEISGSAAILHLNDEQYYGLDEVGTRMWRGLLSQGTIRGAANELAAEYDAPQERIETDMIELVKELESLGLLEIRI